MIPCGEMGWLAAVCPDFLQGHDLVAVRTSVLLALEQSLHDAPALLAFSGGHSQ
jgi:hypothetical protein